MCLVSANGLSAQPEDWQQALQQAQAYLEAGKTKKALHAFELQADKGNGLAQFNLALFHQNGWGDVADPQVACHWYAKAANNNIPAAQYETARCILNETDSPDQVDAALKWYLRAFENQIYKAGCEAGKLLLTQQVDKKTLRQGVTLCLDAAEKGSIDAALQVANWYRDGQYLSQSYLSAMHFYALAAPEKQPSAAFQMARILDMGLDVETDIRQAAYWYEVAASQGYEQAYLPVAALYWKLTQDAHSDQAHLLAKAYLWAKTAKQRSSDEVRDVAEKLLVQVSDVIPMAWIEELDKKVVSHIHAFH
ncbi:tetratricopeptide repeat protein [Alteromonas ponticola]|uniref:Sel1 repeat family protein n=1 Tax=Alteromonas ponticola TaxID=2720613 RepID=A0ABX1QZM9_9ALTE|nr:tetratricopeptide repeat protein [Alteromonas ponticola]NMH59126.1 sel1 repeat family protein [Alteromonas ponticola]